MALHHYTELHNLMLVLRTFPKDYYWIGLHFTLDYITLEDEWMWTDESYLTFDNWAENEPKDSSTYDKTFINTVYQNGGWFTGTDTQTRRFICEKWPKGNYYTHEIFVFVLSLLFKFCRKNFSKLKNGVYFKCKYISENPNNVFK